jgi:protein TonB
VRAQRSGEQGDVYLKVYVHENGSGDRVQVAKSSGYPDLDNAAIESVLNWRYIPASQNGQTVADWTTLHLVYQLPQSAEATPK